VSPRVPALPEGIGTLGQTNLVMLSIAFGAICGLVALLLIETMRAFDRRLRPRAASHPYATAMVGGVILAALFRVAGDAYAGLGSATIEAALRGDAAGIGPGAPLVKIGATALTLEVGGSGGIVTPLFFIGSTTGVAFARLFHLPVGLFAAFGFVAVLAAAANTPIAAAVMGMELLPGPIGVYAALCAGAAFLMVGHRSVYASQRLGLVKSAGLDVDLDVPIGEIHRTGLRIRKDSLTDRTLRLHRRLRPRSLLRRRRLR
jgi:chloride channel protein, CIC family